jgi:formylglycine-generating enzyme required for sulfatase activity
VGGSGAPGLPYLVTSENAISYANSTGNLFDNGLAGASAMRPAGFAVPADYPKGFRAFYAMKYEITQGEYTDYLNSLPQDMAQSMAYTFTGFRYNITGSWPSFACPVPYRAHNNLYWTTLCSYLDWTGLAPMSEFEYEKLCRGTAYPIAYEYAWGSNTFTRVVTVAADGSAGETVSDVIAPSSGPLLAGGFTNSGIQGPLRVGFAAKNGTTRVESGAGFYGNMELTGNVSEYCTSVAGNGAAAFKWDAHGDGSLAPVTGYSNVNGWVNQNSGAANTGGSIRGGDWRTDVSVISFNSPYYHLMVSNRVYGANIYSQAANTTGGVVFAVCLTNYEPLPYQ